MYEYTQNIRLDGPLKVSSVSDKIISVTDEENAKPFDMIAILPMAPTANDTDITHDINQVERY